MSSPISFAFLYQALRAQNRPISEVHEFQISVRDANELLRACLAGAVPASERVLGRVSSVAQSA